MKPYYERGGITIWNADSREVTPPHNSFVVTDPPYGIGGDTSKCHQDRGSVTAPSYLNDEHPRHRDVSRVPGAVAVASFCDQKLLTDFWRDLEKRGFRPKSCFYWDKGRGGVNPRQALVSCVEAGIVATRGGVWTGGGATPNIFYHQRDTRPGRFHPTEKPVPVMAWLCGLYEGPIFDPFMGSGSTLVAAKATGRACVGVELEEKLCEIAAKRLDGTTGSLF